jgi:uncharacterized membrane protein (UPF0127 family)
MAEIQGTPNIDFLDGTFDSDTIFGLGGNDVVRGFGGSDLIFGNEDNDLLNGDSERDSIYGGKGDDSVFGGEGEDWLLGDRGNDLVLGGLGKDTIYGGKDADSLYGGDGDDLLWGDRGSDLLVADIGRDTLIGGEGSDRFVIGRVGASEDTDTILDFENGIDQIVLTDGLELRELNIFGQNGNLIIQDETTQENIAVLLGVASLDDSSVISLVGDLEDGQVLPIGARTTINGQSIGLEVARTPLEQAVGLMFRSDLGENRGMLFPLNPPRVASFWMRNVFFELDMVFVRNGVVEAVFSNVPPCLTERCPSYGPDTVVDGVIELRGGRAEELGLQVGDRLDIELLG